MHAFLTSVVSVIVVLGILIFIHELGHYLAAKFFKVRVEVFSLGFGKRLFGFRRGETDYRVALIPLGGYVKMAGENPMEPRSGDPGEFMSHPRWQRFIIALAGPAANILLAVGVLTGVYMVHYEHPVYLDKPAVIGWVLNDSPAAKAGIQAGDRIVRINSIQDPTWEDVATRILLSPGQPVDLAIQRGNQVLNTKITPEKSGPEEFGTNPGWTPDQPNTITALEPEMPAAKAGLKVGDEIVAVNGRALRSMPAIIHFLQENGEKPVEITVVRDGHEIKAAMTPVAGDLDGERRYRIGIRSDPQHIDRLPFLQALDKSIEQNKRYSVLIVELMGKLVQRKVSMKQIDGPIGIARASGEAARMEGWTPLLQLLAAISLNLGIFNLMPFPILDGGVIMLLLIESVRRRDISLRVKERIYQVAFVLLILFAALVIYNDIGKALPGLSKYLPG